MTEIARGVYGRSVRSRIRKGKSKSIFRRVKTLNETCSIPLPDIRIAPVDRTIIGSIASVQYTEE